MTWTPKNLPDLTGKVAVVTGANSGIGFHTARHLAAHGAEVVLACRNTESATQAAAKIPGKTRVAQLDLSSQKNVAAFAERWAGPLDLLVNNAGVMTPPKWRATEDGHELQFGTNHLGHYALTGLLLPHMLAAPAPRVVTVSSLAHHRGKQDVVEGNPAERYEPEAAYGNSKLANILFAFELQRRAETGGSNLVSNAAHPGIAVTGLVPDPDGMGANPLVRVAAPLVMRVVFQSAAAGANPTLYAATEAGPASYTGPQWVREQRGPVGPAKLQRRARDEDLAARLWDVSEELTGVRFAF
jgi:NAD(P)-dependent dehydrogenase (short-subunit alcohol dehydrogenase family)